jgi:hypothetical protein
MLLCRTIGHCQRCVCGLIGTSAYAGPTFGPIIGAFITGSSIGWRWTAWITLIMAAVFGIPAYLLVPETYGRVLREKADRRLNKSNPLSGFLQKFLRKPVHILVTEPMVCYGLICPKLSSSANGSTLACSNDYLHLHHLRHDVADVLRDSIRIRRSQGLASHHIVTDILFLAS